MEEQASNSGSISSLNEGTRDAERPPILSNLNYLDLTQMEFKVIEGEAKAGLKNEALRREIEDTDSTNAILRADIVKYQMVLEETGEKYKNEMSLRAEVIELMSQKREVKEEIIHILDVPYKTYKKLKADGFHVLEQLKVYRKDHKKRDKMNAMLMSDLDKNGERMASSRKFIEQQDKDESMAKEAKAKLAAEIKELGMTLLAEEELTKQLLKEEKPASAEYDGAFSDGTELDKRIAELKGAPKRSPRALANEADLAKEGDAYEAHLEQLRDELETNNKCFEASEEAMEEMEIKYAESADLLKNAEEEIWDVSHNLETLKEETDSLEVDDGIEAELQKEFSAMEALDLASKQRQAEEMVQLKEDEMEYEQLNEMYRSAEEARIERAQALEEVDAIKITADELVWEEDTNLSLEAQLAELESEMEEFRKEAVKIARQNESELRLKEDEFIRMMQAGTENEKKLREKTEKYEQIMDVKNELDSSMVGELDKEMKQVEFDEKLVRYRMEEEIRMLTESCDRMNSELADIATYTKELRLIVDDMGEEPSLEDDIRLIQERLEYEFQEKQAETELNQLCLDEEKTREKLRDLLDNLSQVQSAIADDPTEIEELLPVRKDVEGQKNTIDVEKAKLEEIKLRDGPRRLLAENDMLEREFERELQELERKEIAHESKKAASKRKQVNKLFAGQRPQKPEPQRQCSQDSVFSRKSSMKPQNALSQSQPNFSQSQPAYFRLPAQPPALRSRRSSKLQNEQVSSSSWLDTKVKLLGQSGSAKRVHQGMKKVYAPPTDGPFDLLSENDL